MKRLALFRIRVATNCNTKITVLYIFNNWLLSFVIIQLLDTRYFTEYCATFM